MADEPEVFALIQGDQGLGYLSDGDEDACSTEAERFAILRLRLFFHERAGRKPRKYLRDRGELRGPWPGDLTNKEPTNDHR